MIEFAQPHWLGIGALACVALVLLLVRAARKRRAAISVFAAASTETSVARHRRLLRNGLTVAGLAFAALAMARPLAGYRWEQQPHQGVDLMFAVDTSRSMLAADLRPDRLTRAKLAVADLARKFDGERLGLIAFAGDAFVQAPMTVDRGVFLASLDTLDTSIIPHPGTDLASAIRAAEQAMSSEPGHRKVLVMLSDGEDLAGDALDAARDAATRGLSIYTVGVGGTQGQLIEIAGEDGKPELVRDEHGEPVRSKLDESTLRRVAQVSGGAYQRLGAEGRGLEILYSQARAQLPLHTTMGTARKVYTERYQIPLALALGCLLGELALGDRARKRRPAGDRRRRRSRLRASRIAGISALVLLGAPQLALAAPARESAVTSYNAGTERYRSGEFDKAQQAFETALRTDDVTLQVDTYFDLGNARYRAGQATLAKQDRPSTIATWKRAIEAYDAALALAPADPDAKFNRDFVAKKLAALEQENKQENEQENKQKNKQENSQQNQQQDQQQKSGAGQNQQQDQQQKPGAGQNQQQDQQQQSGAGQNQQQDQQQKSGAGHDQQQKSGAGQNQLQKSGAGPQPQHDPESASGDRQDPRDLAKRPAPNAPDAAATRTDEPSAPSQSAAASRRRSAEAAERARADEARRAAGALTSEEAVQLLESVEGELEPLPITGRKNGQPQHTYSKDW